MTAEAFDVLHDDMRAHMVGKDYFVQDLFAGADPRYRIGVRIVSELAWHNLFIRHMLIRPEASQLDDFMADFTLVNCPSFFADPERHGCRTETVIAFNMYRICW
jgi:phosphoenolpyruvate carboxykinase (ATP)